jgi:glyoxylase-like metal-dependent hydrolase (beta-lactamase superfamily II)
VLPWAVHALRAGGTTHVPICEPRAFPAAGALDLPGAPVPVNTPGHTKGHCAYHLPDRGILITGDALVTAHPTARISGPQLLPDMFHSDRARALDSLTAPENLDAGLLLPGHGLVHQGSAKEAAATAREQVIDRPLSRRNPVAGGSTTYLPGSTFEGALVRVTRRNSRETEEQPHFPYARAHQRLS